VRALVTGAAGFVGSHLCEHLTASGDEVLAVDCFTGYYDRARKEANLAAVTRDGGARFVETDLRTADIAALIRDVEVVYHLAAQPGVRASWGADFAGYVEHNILATQRLAEACATSGARVVYASSSSVYGDAESLPTRETAIPDPVSPYGVTKLAAEHLLGAYAKGGLPVASLRLFTVYGPRQRPDMAFARLVEAALRDEAFEVYGDGEQTRDFTFVSDVTAAFRACATAGWTGVANIGGGSRTSLNEAIAIVERLAGPVRITRKSSGRGDVRHTSADTARAREGFGYLPTVSPEEGLERMVEAARVGAGG